MAKKSDTPEGPLFASHAPVQVKTIDDLYSDWFLDYASYVILERAVPHINDGFKRMMAGEVARGVVVFEGEEILAHRRTGDLAAASLPSAKGDHACGPTDSRVGFDSEVT